MASNRLTFSLRHGYGEEFGYPQVNHPAQ